MSSSQSRFFQLQTQASAAKAHIVTNYFRQWAAILARWNPAIQYVDLYCGPGGLRRR